MRESRRWYWNGAGSILTVVDMDSRAPFSLAGSSSPERVMTTLLDRIGVSPDTAVRMG